VDQAKRLSSAGAVSDAPKSALSRDDRAARVRAAPPSPPAPLRLWRWREMFPRTRTGLVQDTDIDKASARVADVLRVKGGPHKGKASSFYLVQLPRDTGDKTLPTKPFCITLRAPRRHPWKEKRK